MHYSFVIHFGADWGANSDADGSMATYLDFINITSAFVNYINSCFSANGDGV